MSAEALKPTEIDTFLFDLRGYLLLKDALTAKEVAACNADIDAILAPQCRTVGWIRSRPSVWPCRRPESATDL